MYYYMVLYECFRCGYNTKLKGNMNHHLNRKNVCEPIEDDISIVSIKNYYGFEKKKYNRFGAGKTSFRGR